MVKSKIITSFSRYNDAELEQKAELILNSMEGNSFFETPFVKLSELDTAIKAFDLAIIKAKDGGKVEMLERNNRRKELTALLDKLALYVQLMGEGNDVALVSSGFSLSKTPNPIGVLPKPQGFTVTAKNPGTITLKLKAVHGAKSYQYEYRKKGDSGWIIVADTKHMLTLTTLESGVGYEFRVTGIGANTQRVYSDILSSFIL